MKNLRQGRKGAPREVGWVIVGILCSGALIFSTGTGKGINILLFSKSNLEEAEPGSCNWRGHSEELVATCTSLTGHCKGAPREQKTAESVGNMKIKD